MSAPVTLKARLSAEFDAREARRRADEQGRLREAQTRELALARFSDACEQLLAHWEPKLAVFSDYFASMLKVVPTITPDQRQVQVVFLTDLANMTMSLCASLSTDLRSVVVDYGLQIIPIFFEYERNARLELPLDGLDMDQVERWVDDRLVACVKAYLSVQDNKFYTDRASIEDPITKVRFLRSNAVAHLNHNGKVVYFATQQSMRDYKRLHELGDERGSGCVGVQP